MSGPEAARPIAEAVDRRLGDLFATEKDRWGALDGELGVALQALADYALSGGKRLRPAFCYWAFVGCGGRPDDRRVVDAAAALELLHTAALVHDDVIDRSELRHGNPTVHVRFSEMHRTRRWRGDAAEFGRAAAILLGDLALVYSSRLLAGAPPEAVAVFEEMRVEVNIGQYLDVVGTAQGMSFDPAGAVQRAERICRYKTAKYTVERPLHLGAALADPQGWARWKDPLSRFGLPLGEAFQLRDDLLGTFGDPDVTGKPVGDDLRAGKPTRLAALAAARHPSFAERFDAGDTAGLENAVVATGARGEVETQIAHLLGASRRALGQLPLTERAVTALSELASFVAGRDL